MATTVLGNWSFLYMGISPKDREIELTFIYSTEVAKVPLICWPQGMKKVPASTLPKPSQLTPTMPGEHKTRFQEGSTIVGSKGTSPYQPIQPPPSKWGTQKAEKWGSGEEMTPAKTLVALIKHQGQCL